MRMLIDTHAFLWFNDDNERLSATARENIQNRENIIFLSVASVWELAIKSSLGKLDIPRPAVDFVEGKRHIGQIELLEITVSHIRVVEALFFHHRDPFDRLLIAQALSENIPIISTDAIFDAYGVQRVW